MREKAGGVKLRKSKCEIEEGERERKVLQKDMPIKKEERGEREKVVQRKTRKKRKGVKRDMKQKCKRKRVKIDSKQ